MYYLDIKTPMINFQEYRNSLYVDKTLMIDKIQNRIRTLNPTYLLSLKSESSACFWIKDMQICWLLILQKVMIVENYSKD